MMIVATLLSLQKLVRWKHSWSSRWWKHSATTWWLWILSRCYKEDWRRWTHSRGRVPSRLHWSLLDCWPITWKFREDTFQQLIPDWLSKPTRWLANRKNSSKGKEKTVHDLDLRCCCRSDAKTTHHSTCFPRNWGWDWYRWENEKPLALPGIRDLCSTWERRRAYWGSPDWERNPEIGAKRN